MRRLFSFSDDFYEYGLATASIEFTVENLLPRAKIKFTICHGDNYFTPHDLALHMGVGIVFTCVVVAVLVNWFMRCKFFQPLIIILMQVGFIIDEDRGCYMHGANQSKVFLDSAFSQPSIHFGGDVL